MNEPMHAIVLNYLEATKGKWSEVAHGSDVSKRTLEKIARREIEDPGVSHIQKLFDFSRSTSGRRLVQ